MNDELKSGLIKIAILGLTALATTLHMNSDATVTAQIPALATDVVDAGVLLYGFWQNRAMKKVPVDSIVVGGAAAAPVVVAAQAVANLPPTASPVTIQATKSAANLAVADHNP